MSIHIMLFINLHMLQEPQENDPLVRFIYIRYFKER